ncbi:MAG: pitrilysin family protein [bacterium]|nr:pitrilysin family protein [bacterium]
MEIIRLKNGIPVLVRPSNEANSISIGIYTMVGLLQEPRDANGIAHYLEHMCFKRTLKRSARQITEAVDNMGGSINAHTTKEYTGYFITALPHCQARALDILFDLYLNCTLTEADMAMEKQVVLEEINMYEDTPDDLIHDLYSGTIWKGSRMGRPILGTAETLAAIDKPMLDAFKENYHHPENIVISVAGKIPNMNKLIDRISNFLGHLSSDVQPYHTYFADPKNHPTIKLLKKPIEQVHLCAGVGAYPLEHPDYYKSILLASILGGSMSSRLFQKIREKKGWAYSVYAYGSAYLNSGLFTVYAGINKDKFLPTLRIILDECHTLTEKAVTKKELKKVKEQLKGNLILSLERSGSWMSWMGRSMMYLNRLRTVDEVIADIDSVTIDGIQSVAGAMFAPDRFTVAGIGPFADSTMAWDGRASQELFQEKRFALTR